MAPEKNGEEDRDGRATNQEATSIADFRYGIIGELANPY